MNKEEIEKITEEFTNFVETQTDFEIRTHLHPAPAIVWFLEKFLEENYTNRDHMTGSEIISFLDMVVRFGMYLGSKGIRYDQFSKCQCEQVTQEEIDKLLNS